MTAKSIDWSQLWYPGPKRAFTADEMARAGGEGPSATLLAVVGVNIALPLFATMQWVPQALTARLTGLLAMWLLLGCFLARWLWWRPWRRPLMQASMSLIGLLLTSALLLRWRMPDREDRVFLHGVDRKSVV